MRYASHSQCRLGPVSYTHLDVYKRQDLIWPLLEVLYPGTRETFGLPGICLSLADKPDELAALEHYWQLIERESVEQLPGREHTLTLLAQAVFTLSLIHI